MKRLGPGGLTLVALLAWAACAYEPIEPPPGLEPSEAAPSLFNLEYQGDRAGVRSRSKVLRLLSSPGREGLLRLANAEVFAWSHAGIGGDVSPHALAFRAVLREPRSRDAFLELVESARPEARLYGLAGLYLVDPAAFRVLAALFREFPAQAMVLVGCTGGRQDLASVIGTGAEGSPQLWNGSWSRDLAGR